jgi:hypothetical protein
MWSEAMEATSNAEQTRIDGDGLSQLKRQFEQWRGARNVGQRIPAHLWDGAVSAVTEHGACRVSAELHLDYKVLKRRVALAAGNAPVTAVAPRFVELFAPGRSTKSAPSHPECVVEMDNARGAKMRVELGGNALAAGLSALCGAFWSA